MVHGDGGEEGMAGLGALASSRTGLQRTVACRSRSRLRRVATLYLRCAKEGAEAVRKGTRPVEDKPFLSQQKHSGQPWQPQTMRLSLGRRTDIHPRPVRRRRTMRCRILLRNSSHATPNAEWMSLLRHCASSRRRTTEGRRVGEALGPCGAEAASAWQQPRRRSALLARLAQRNTLSLRVQHSFLAMNLSLHSLKRAIDGYKVDPVRLLLR